MRKGSWGRLSCLQPAFQPARPARKRVGSQNWLPHILFLLAALPAGAQDYSRDIQPIWEKHCFGCHAPKVKMGSFELGTYEQLMTPGPNGKVVAPGKAVESRLYRMLTGAIEPAMPMGGKRLPEGELELIRKWIDAGAKAPTAASVAAPVVKILPRGAVKAQIYSVAWHSSLLALGGFRKVNLREPASQKSIATLDGHADAVRAVAFSRDGKLLAAAGGLPAVKGELVVWDVQSRTPLRRIEGHTDCIYAAAISPDGKLIATAGYDKLIKLWDSATGNELRTLKDHIDAIYALQFTPDGKRLVSGAADRTVKIWDTNSGERLYTLGEPTDGINAIALDPQGKRVAAAGLDKSIRVWSLGAQGGMLLHTLIAHEDAILQLAWSPDGRTLVSSSADRSVKIFRADDLTELKTIAGQPEWAPGLVFSPDGKWLATGRLDGSLSLYDTTDYKDALDERRAMR